MTAGPANRATRTTLCTALVAVLCLGPLLTGSARAALAATVAAALPAVTTGERAFPEPPASPAHGAHASHAAAADEQPGPAAHVGGVPCDTPCEPDRPCPSDCGAACASGCCPSPLASDASAPPLPSLMPARPSRPHDVGAPLPPATPPPLRPPIA